MIGMPGASSSMKDGIAKQIAAAGGTLSGRIQLSSDYTDPKRASDLLSLAKQVHPIGLTLPVTSGRGDGRRLPARIRADPAKDSRATSCQTLTAMSSAQMLKVEGSDNVTPARVVVVVSRGTLPANDAGGATQLDLVTQLQLAGAHTLVAGDNPSSTGGGLVALVRNSDADKSTVSTVDDADTVVGQVASVLALAEVAGGKSGAYGTGSGVQSIFPSASR